MSAGQPLLTHPRTPGEILDRTALLVRAGFGQSWRAVLLGYLPWTILLTLPMVPLSAKLTRGVPPLRSEVVQHTIWVAIYLVVDLLLLRQFVRGWLFAIDGAELRGMKVTSAQAAAHGLRRLPSAAVATLLTAGPLGSTMLLGTLMASQDPGLIGIAMLATPLLLLIGLPLLLLGYVAVAVVQLERRGPLAALMRSFRLCGPQFGAVLILAVVLLIIRFFSGLIAGLIPNLWIQSALQSATGAMLVIFDVALESVLYFTCRCRREDYDLELVSREVELWGAEEIETAPPASGRFQFGQSTVD